MTHPHQNPKKFVRQAQINMFAGKVILPQHKRKKQPLISARKRLMRKLTIGLSEWSKLKRFMPNKAGNLYLNNSGPK